MHSKKIACLFLFISLLGLNKTYGQNVTDNDQIIGVWEVGNGRARIKISRYGDKYSGKMVWLKEPLYTNGVTKRDTKNPIESKRTSPLIGSTNLLGFEYKGNSTWGNGTIYDPQNGSTYNCVIKLIDENTLDVRGFIGIQLIGRTDTWKRV
ncbi:MAG: DUF2147 domain-containing protein [Bacteroidota bacterium]